jgi:hypothetical protein
MVMAINKSMTGAEIKPVVMKPHITIIPMQSPMAKVSAYLLLIKHMPEEASPQLAPSNLPRIVCASSTIATISRAYFVTFMLVGAEVPERLFAFKEIKRKNEILGFFKDHSKRL